MITSGWLCVYTVSVIRINWLVWLHRFPEHVFGTFIYIKERLIYFCTIYIQVYILIYSRFKHFLLLLNAIILRDLQRIIRKYIACILSRQIEWKPEKYATVSSSVKLSGAQLLCRYVTPSNCNQYAQYQWLEGRFDLTVPRVIQQLTCHFTLLTIMHSRCYRRIFQSIHDGELIAV